MKNGILTVFIGASLCILTSNAAAENNPLQEKWNQDIQRYISIGKSNSSDESQELAESIVDQTEKLKGDATPLIIQKIKNSNNSEQALSVYIWVAGFTKDPNLVDTLIEIYKNNSAEIVKENALRSMANIGSAKAGEYLLAIAQKTPIKNNTPSDEPERYDILDLLATMQYEKAFPEMEYILKNDYKEYYWQSIFCYGKMGENAIPYLMKKIEDSNVNVRFNSINLLGQILIATEASAPLCKQYWKEKNPDVKRLILSSLEKIIPDIPTMKQFFGNVAAKEQNADLKKFAQETVSGTESYKKMATEFKHKSKPNKVLFNTEYEKLFKSAGKKGAIDALGIYSTPEDVPSLQQLKRRFLDRNSDECFYDYDEINVIIMTHRLIVQNKDIQ